MKYEYISASLGSFICFIILLVNSAVLAFLLDNSYKLKKRLKIFFKIGTNKVNSETLMSSGSNANTTSTSATNAFLISMCISDLLIGLFVLPIFIITQFRPNVWNENLCRAYKFFKFFSFMSNSYSNVSIAIERFRFVVLKAKYSYRTIIINILAFYLISFGLSLLELRRFKIVYYEDEIDEMNPNGTACEHDDNINMEERIIHSVSFFIISSLLPLALIVFFYVLILYNLKKSSKRMGTITNTTINNMNTSLAVKLKKFTKMFWELVLIFTLSHVPYGVASLADELFELEFQDFSHIFLDLTLVITASHGFMILIPYRSLFPIKLFRKTNTFLTIKSTTVRY